MGPLAHPQKRIKLESSPTPSLNFTPSNSVKGVTKAEDLEEDHCSICLQPIADRTVIPTCAHEFCFECLLVWSEQSRRCPLCSQNIGGFLIHRVRSRFDYQKYYLLRLRTSPVPLHPPVTSGSRQRENRRSHREREWGQRLRREREESDRLERAISRRRWIYQHDLYAKHVASNSYTRYRPYPTPAQFAASQDLISRTTAFLRRELHVWNNLDVEFLTTFIVSLMKSIDIRSESAVKLIAEFLDMDEAYVEGNRHVNAEHFAHEVYSYLRSPYKDLFVYDTIVQYDTPEDLPPPAETERARRWRESHSRSRSPQRKEPSLQLDSRATSSGGRTHSLEIACTPARRGSPITAEGSGERRDRRKAEKRQRISDEGRHSRYRSITPDRRKRSRNRSTSRDAHPTVPEIRGSSENERQITSFSQTDASVWTKTTRRPSDVNEATDIINQLKGKSRAIQEDGENHDHTSAPSDLVRDSRPSIQITGGERLSPPQLEGSSAHPHYNTTHGRPVAANRAPRNRNLIDSVTAHLLSSGTKPANEINDVKDSRSGTDVPSIPNCPSDPSGTTQPVTAARVAVKVAPDTTSLEKRDSRVAPDRDQREKTGTSRSARDIMARTRARMMKPNNNRVVEVLAGSSSAPIVTLKPSSNEDISQLGQRAVPSDASDSFSEKGSISARRSEASSRLWHCDDEITAVDNASISPQPSGNREPDSITTRARLLRRLEEEKQKHHDAHTARPSCPESVPPVAHATAAASLNSPTSPSSLDEMESTVQARSQPATTVWAPNAVADSQAAEAKLRTQAQLRVRLAAAKRAAVVGARAGHSGGVSWAGGICSDDDRREEALHVGL